MRGNHVFHVMNNEWKRTGKNKVQLFMMLLAPCLSIMFTIWGLHYVTSTVSHYEAEVVCRTNEEYEAAQFVARAYPHISVTMDGEYEKRISKGKIDCAVVILDDTVEIVYDSSILTSTSAIKDSSDLASDLIFRLEGEDIYEDLKDFFPEITSIDLSSSAEKLNHNVDQFSGVIGMILFLMMASNALSLSSESITGEKERQTFDTLVLCPARLVEILLGKTLVIFSEISVCGVIGIAATIVAEKLWNKDDWLKITKAVNGSLSWIPAFLILLLSVVFVMTAVFTVIASAFSEAKKSSLFSSAGMALICFGSIIPTFTDSKVVKFLPIANWTSGVHNICTNQNDFTTLLIGLAISIVIFLLGIVLASALWERTAA